jgi:urease accessory protein
MKRIASILTLLIAFAPTLAFAHPGHGEVHTFAGGLAHPFTGLDHLLAAFAIGLWATLSGMRRPWILPLAFVCAMTLSALAGAAGWTLPDSELMIAFSVVVLGLLCATATQLPSIVGVAVVALFALAHGYAHGGEGGAAAPYIAGLITATAGLHLAGMATGYAAQSFGRPALARAAGIAIMLGGVYAVVA